MSFIYEARRWSGNVNDKIRNLSNKFAQYVTSQISSEGEDITIVTEGRLAEDILKYCDSDLTYGKMLGLTTPLPPEEPDGDKLKLYIHGDSFGRRTPDLSLFDNWVRGRGIMRIQRGIDIGNGGSYELVFDGRSVAPFIHENDLTAKGNWQYTSTMTVGYSLLFRMQPFRIVQSGGIDTSPWNYKQDTNNWFTFEITPTGRLYYNTKVKGAATKHIRTPAGLIVPNGRYEVATTYDIPTNTATLYVNNVAYTENDAARADRLPPNISMNWGKLDGLVSPPAGEEYPDITQSKLYCGALQCIKYWREKVLTAAQVGYHYTNKLTIANIPFGQVAYPGMSLAGS